MGKKGSATRTTLMEMGYPWEATKFTTYNSAVDGIIHDTVQQKRSKAMDMCFIGSKQGQFKVGWPPWDTNMGDYFTKHHSPAHHKCMRLYYLHIDAAPMISHGYKSPVLQGCVNPKNQAHASGNTHAHMDRPSHRLQNGVHITSQPSYSTYERKLHNIA
jgi:hypothetical protein